MIEIIKYGSKKRITCSGCESVLSYNENEDVEKKPYTELDLGSSGMCERITKYRKYIICPVCKHQIDLDPTTK